ncbi:MAG TPA: class I SAM-dependent methyltransferase [Nocardioides sp.]|nr:class I SAM-dependent methyltransferase [Nocardioides sp.]
MNHEHEHDHDFDPETMYTQETWDARYAESDRMWSGRPNKLLVDEVADLTPGRALDVGCGEGADAVWLAGRGWRVTALDVSEVALARVREHARDAGVAEGVETLHHDLMAGGPAPGRYDLVSAFFFQVPEATFEGFYRGLADLVEPGGTLLVVGHHPDDIHSGARRPHGPQLMFTPEQVVALLEPEAWDVVTEGAPTREQVVDGTPVVVRDTLVRAVRR